MAEYTIYYNPKCGSCRTAKEILEKRGAAVKVVEYLKTPPTAAEIEGILKKLNAGPEAITRFKEAAWEEKGGDPAKLSREKWVRLLAENPILIQRPIVVAGGRAVVARPPEKVEELL